MSRYQWRQDKTLPEGARGRWCVVDSHDTAAALPFGRNVLLAVVADCVSCGEALEQARTLNGVRELDSERAARELYEENRLYWE